MKKKRIFVDMDNTLYDMKTPYIKALKITPEIAYPQSQYGFSLTWNSCLEQKKQ